ncbi:hypothetical protein MARINOS108_10637 [Marinoscillum sp. 108]|nr:hypothetical protein MARINOS108_10637 [Marinoscillum sp. 108]
MLRALQTGMNDTSSFNPLTSSGFGPSIAQNEYRNPLMVRGYEGVLFLIISLSQLT